jgi:hypothetical protein
LAVAKIFFTAAVDLPTSRSSREDRLEESQSSAVGMLVTHCLRNGAVRTGTHEPA